MKLSQEIQASRIVHKEVNLELIVSLSHRWRNSKKPDTLCFWACMAWWEISLTSQEAVRKYSWRKYKLSWMSALLHCWTTSHLFECFCFSSSWWVTISLGIFKWCSWASWCITSPLSAWQEITLWNKSELKLRRFIMFLPQMLKLENCMIRILLQKSHSDSTLESNKTRGSQEA